MGRELGHIRYYISILYIRSQVVCDFNLLVINMFTLCFAFQAAPV